MSVYAVFTQGRDCRGMLCAMKRSSLVIVWGAFSLARVSAAETVVDPLVESVAMFKNGLTVVKSSFQADAPGEYVWVDPPITVHGAFFVESAPGLVIRSTTRLMKSEGPTLPGGNLQQDLAGATVRVGMQGGEQAPGEEVRGRVWPLPKPDRLRWNTNYATTGGRSYFPGSHPGAGTAVSTGNWLVLDEGGQRRFLSLGRIAQIRVEEEAAGVREEPRPVMVFAVKGAGPVQLTYLTKGMAWMPAYQVDLLEGERMRLRQTAVVRNELMDLDETTLELISGYPNIKFSHVDSPLGAGATLAAFFQQISQEGGAQVGAMSQQIAYNTIANRASEAVMPLPQPDAGAPAEDLHYESIGRHALQEGDSLSLEVARAETSCERVVEWKVPDYRDDYGRLQRRGRGSEDEEPWDAVQFANPLPFPMTTAAASVLEDGRFRGQSMANWTAPGHQACIRINKALTVRGEHSEVEEEGEREIVWIAGDDYQRTKVGGTLKLSNARGEPVRMVVELDFSGQLISADGDPARSLRADGARSVNPHRQLEWVIDLAAGESKTLTYRYSVLVNR